VISWVSGTSPFGSGCPGRKTIEAATSSIAHASSVGGALMLGELVNLCLM